jgi:4-methylaminobutanoate oxidase (formaldehyde-forming)
MVLFKLVDPEPLLFHDELIRIGDEIVGYITSGAYSFTLGRSVGMGYVRHADGVTDEFVDNSRFHIEIAGETFAADASLKAFYDPTRRRVMA